MSSTPICASATRALPTPTTWIRPRAGHGSGRHSTLYLPGARWIRLLPPPWGARSSGGGERLAARGAHPSPPPRGGCEPLAMTLRRRLVRVPASSANLGPGYDVLAAALPLHLELEVSEEGGFSVEVDDDALPADRSNLCVRAFETLHPADGLRFAIRSQIPVARGLGSSAAAIVAGLMAADHLFELALDRDEVYLRAVELEGHPDNVGAAVYGGFVLCPSPDGDVRPRPVRLDPPQGVEGVVVIPSEEVATEQARAAIPAELPVADDIHEVSHDWATYSSELGGVTALTEAIMPLELIRAMFIGMDPPKHDRLKMLFQRGFTPKRIAEREDEIRAISGGVLDRLARGETCDLVTEVAQPVVSRVIGSFMGIPPEDDEIWARLMNTTLGAGDPDLNPEGVESVMQRDVPEIFERCRRLIAERRERPTDDFTSVLVHAEVDGERLEEHEIVMGFFLLVAAGNDSTKATYCSGMRALMEHPDQRQLLLDDPSLIPGAVEESLRMFPAFAHFRRTATRDTELNGCPIRRGDKVVMWYVSSNRDESRYEDPDRFDVARNPEHQAFGAGGRHFCLGASLARLELKILLEETLARFPAMALAGTPVYAESPFLNQLKA